MEINKSTTTGYKTELFMPIMKSAEGKYIAVLSDDSTDRDGEMVSKGCLQKMAEDNGYLAALLNHDNDIMNLVAEWTNKRVVEVDGHTAFVAEPKFYTANPKAVIIKGMLDQGAKPGISIGAMVKDYDEINNKRVYTELELAEGSFVGIPSNRHGRAMLVAKSFKNKIIKLEANKMEKEFTKKDLDSEIAKKVEEVKTDFTKQLESKDAEIVKMKEDLEKSIKVNDEAKVAADKVAKDFKEITVKHTELEAEKVAISKELDELKKMSKMKGDSSTVEGEANAEHLQKAFDNGAIPIVKG